MRRRQRKMRREAACRFRLSGAIAAVGGTVVAFTLALGVSSTAAQAATGHVFLSSLREAPPGTAMAEAGAVAVERSSGRVFVADLGRGVIDVFNASGSFESQFGQGVEAATIAVDETSGDLYVAEPVEDRIVVFKLDGKGSYVQLSEWLGANVPEGQFGEVSGVAVDNSTSISDPHAGDVFITDAGTSAVYILKPKLPGPEEAKEGSFVSSLSGGKLEEPNGVALDSASGRAYVADSSKGFVAIYGSSGAFEKKLTGAGSPNGSFLGPEEEEGNVTAVSIDEASGEIYVAEAQRRVLAQFSSEGKWIGQVSSTPSGALIEPRGVAIAPTGDVYLADAQAHLIDVFGPDVPVPDAKTNAASKVAKTTAILNGVVNGDGKVAKYRFQWGTSEGLGQETSTQSAGTAEEKVAAELSALKAGTSYFFRLVAENENGQSFGAIREVKTRQAVEGLSTGPVTNLKPTEATVTGTLNPKGIDTHYYFQWGKTVAYGSFSPQPPGTDAGSGKEAIEAKTSLTGLEPNSTYHYRLVGEDEFGQSAGEDAQFTTSGPPRISSEATTVEGHEAATLHARINPDKLETKYHFEYGETSAYGTEVPSGGATIPAGEVAVAESALLTKLKIGTTYHFRVVATNAAGTTDQPDQTFTTVPPALIEAEHAAEVSSSQATLQTQINPLGHDTTYAFRYGTEPCQPNPSACTEIPSPRQDIGSGEVGVAKSVRLEGLKAAATYHYRVIAQNSLGTAEGQERTFSTQESEKPFALPDGRAFEMVSSVDKHGAPIEALTREGGVILAAEDGNALTYVANGSIVEEPKGNRSPELQQVISRRGSKEWESQDIATPHSSEQGVSAGATPEYQFFSPNLLQALVEPWGKSALSEPPLAPEAVQKTIYIRDNASGTYLPLVVEANVADGTKFGDQLHFLTATPDLSHVILESKVALSGESSRPGLYEWAGGKLQFVSVLPNGTGALEPEMGFDRHVFAHALSNDGTRVVWTVADESPEGVHRGHLYMSDTALGQTIQLDAAQGAPEPERGSAQFQTASADGSKVFFTDKQRLTADSTAEPISGKADLYGCDVAEEASKLVCHLKDLTVEQNEGEHANVQGFLFGASEDGSSVYLVAQGMLAGNQNGNGEAAEAGKDNLYASHFDGSHWVSTFIAQLSSEDSAEWEGSKLANTAYLTARVSPNGRYLAFMSAASPTGYDNVDQTGAKHDEEVYLYDAASASLRCVSCNPTGARPMGVLDTEEAGEGLGLVVDRRKIWIGRWLAGNIPGWTAQSINTALLQTRYLSDSGRLFFNSADALVPHVLTRTREEDVSGSPVRVGVENVYEYEPSGVGGCESTSGGCVSLISSGSSGRESAFLEATPTGNDVFFLTASQLLSQDTDTAFDVYDARVCTPSSPCLTPPSASGEGCTSASTCRPAAPAQQAPFGSSGSATVSGQGNILAPANGGHLGVKASKPQPLTRAQKLARALKACKRLKAKKKRHACEVRARRTYGARHKAGTSNAGSSHKHPAKRRAR
jgi:DNA-binding beta-propeller fold protein YncE